MAALREQAQGIVNVCKTVIAGKMKDQGVDNQTISIAQEILKQAKALLPEDKVLAATDLTPPVSYWTTLLSAMEIVDKSLPAHESESLAETIRKARERKAELNQPVDEAIMEYLKACEEYEKVAEESPSYSMIEIPKLKIADAVLKQRGIPTGPKRMAA
jgi:hypothetical protein